jgi:hypothetical protein
VGSGYATIVSILGLPEAGAQDQTLAVGAAQRWFSSHENWLLILDNADDLAMAREFIPPGNNGHVLLTTRARASGTVARRLDIKEMGTEEGALLLRTAPVRQQPPPGPYANATVTRREEYRRTGAKHTRLLPKPSPHRRFRSPLHGPGGDERTY